MVHWQECFFLIEICFKAAPERKSQWVKIINNGFFVIECKQKDMEAKKTRATWNAEKNLWRMFFFKSRPKCVIGVVDFSSLGWKNSEKIEPRRQRRVVLYLTCFRRRLHRRRRHTKSFACFAAVVVVVVVVVVVRACKSQKERCAVQQEQQMKQQHRFWLLLSCSEFSRIPAGH